MDKTCPICGFVLLKFPIYAGSYSSITCSRCGEYKIFGSALAELKMYNLSQQQITNIVGFISENQNFELNRDTIIKLKNLPVLSFGEKADKILQKLVELFPCPGQNFNRCYDLLQKNIDNKGSFYNSSENENNELIKDYLSIYATSRAENLSEFLFLFNDYLVKEKKYIFGLGDLRITPTGWAHLESLKQRNIESKTAFIAMRFTDPLLKFCDEYIEKGIRSAGYEPIRIDKHEHNNLIDDEIIAGIRKSKFVVADFTENSYGAYYEAGYARGFNLPVIYMCNEKYFQDEKTRPHFDVNHYSMILWGYDKGEELSIKLKNRIEATIGRGPLNF